MRLRYKKFLSDGLYDNDNIFIFSIYSNEFDYKLAYSINRSLDISLSKEYKEMFTSVFPFFSYKSEEASYNLFSNRVFLKGQSTTMFEDLYPVTYILPDMKEVNYFFRYEGNKKEEVYQKIRRMQNIFNIILLEKKNYCYFDEIIEL